jgi:hypothetical protein
MKLRDLYDVNIGHICTAALFPYQWQMGGFLFNFVFIHPLHLNVLPDFIDTLDSFPMGHSSAGGPMGCSSDCQSSSRSSNQTFSKELACNYFRIK